MRNQNSIRSICLPLPRRAREAKSRQLPLPQTTSVSERPLRHFFAARGKLRRGPRSWPRGASRRRAGRPLFVVGVFSRKQKMSLFLPKKTRPEQKRKKEKSYHTVPGNAVPVSSRHLRVGRRGRPRRSPTRRRDVSNDGPPCDSDVANP